MEWHWESKEYLGHIVRLGTLSDDDFDNKFFSLSDKINLLFMN